MQTNSSTGKVSDRGPRGGARVLRVAKTDWEGGKPIYKVGRSPKKLRVSWKTTQHRAKILKI